MNKPTTHPTAVATSSPKTKDQTQHVSPDGLWRSFPKVPCLIKYVPSGVYFARVRHKGKLFRQSLETDVFTTAKLRLPDKLKVDSIEEADCRAWAARYSAHYSPTVFNNTVNTLRRILALAGLGHDANPAMRLERLGMRHKKLELPASGQFDRLVALIETSGAAQSKDCADLVRFLAFTGCELTATCGVNIRKHWQPK